MVNNDDQSSQTRGENSRRMDGYAAATKSLTVNGKPYDQNTDYDTPEYVEPTRD